MAKQHPIHRFDDAVLQSTRTKDWLQDLRGNIQRDDNDRFDWLSRKAHYQRRRYGLEMRNPDYPWPGSSEIVLPLIDKKIDELKPDFVNLVIGTPSPVTALAVNERAIANRENVELWFEWLIKWGSPGFQDAIILAADDMLETGRCILKTYWSWDTVMAPETLTKERLPDRLRRLVVSDVSPEVADLLSAMNQQMGVGAPVITKSEFRMMRDQVMPILEQEFQLDEEEDSEAIGEVMAWLESGGDEPLTFRRRDVVNNAPSIAAVSPVDFIVPEPTTDLEGAERICHAMYFNEPMLRRRARDAGWNMKNLRALLDGKKQRGDKGGRSNWSGRWEYMQDQAEREGLRRENDQEYEIWEICTWMSRGQGVPDEKVVVTMDPEQPALPLKVIRYSTPSMKWPYHTSSLEVNKPRFYSPRGVPEILDDLEQEITFEHRAKLNRMMIATSPTFKHRMNSQVNPSNFLWTPGQSYPVQRMDDFEPVLIPDYSISFEREEQILRTWAEERLGGVDHGLANPLSRMSEPRTATEIQGIQQKARQALSLRGAIWQKMMQGVYTEMFQLWHSFGPQETWVRVTGDQPIRLTKEELQGQYVFQVTGTIGQTDPQMEAQKSLARIQVLTQIAQMGLLGAEWELDLGQAVRDWIEKDDIRMSKVILRRRSPQEVQQIQAQQKALEDAKNKALTNTPMSPEEAGIAANELSKKMPFGKAQQLRL